MFFFEKEILLPICESIRKYPDRNAFYINGTFYTYSQFSERISAIRDVIRAAETDEPVWALHLHDDINTYASIFALWMEGKAYVPLHPYWPKERLDTVVEQIGCHNHLDSCDAAYKEDLLDNWKDVSEEDLAYILFTSGSTGKPKGVPLTRSNLANFVSAFWDIGYKLSEQDKCLQCFDLTFDLSIISYLVPLLRGACVYTVPFNAVKFLAICSLMQEHQLTFALMTPSTIQYLRPYMDELNFPAMRYSLFCGEALLLETTVAWAKCIPNAIIDNVYGPTEDTIFCTYYRYKRDGVNKVHNGVLSIGQSVKSGQVAIFDGELCLAGKQLTPGYWNNPKKNTEAFFDYDGIRWYRTGDLCSVDEDGYILFIGRKDSQVKIDGFRIELGEIEYQARQYFGNRVNTISLAYQNDMGLTEIGLFIESDSFSSKSLEEYLRSKLPQYMIPSKIIAFNKFPLNSSEKIDRNALKQML